jgi:hypothetical protein
MMQICAMGATTSVEMLQKLRDGMLSLIMPRIPAQHVCQQCHCNWPAVTNFDTTTTQVHGLHIKSHD